MHEDHVSQSGEYGWKKSSRKKSSLKMETRSTRPTAGVTALKADPDWQKF